VPPIIIYPEGCTSNGRYLLQFKKGAFVGENSIQPLAFKYYSPYINASHDVMGIFEHFFLCAMTPYITLTIKEFPVFKPNEFFWKQHYDPASGKQRWEVYADVIRNIIREAFDFKLTNMSLDEKLEYRRLLEGKEGKTKRA
jgi:lysophosphatidylcholine acyltransferase / lyso-PAF acetyltransferase